MAMPKLKQTIEEASSGGTDIDVDDDQEGGGQQAPQKHSDSEDGVLMHPDPYTPRCTHTGITATAAEFQGRCEFVRHRDSHDWEPKNIFSR